MSNRKDQRTNRVVQKRDPNSPEAIQARLNGEEDPTPYEKYFIIGDPTNSHIYIDLTENDKGVDVGFIILGGEKLTRRLVRSAIGTKDGLKTITNYFVDMLNKQWIIIKDFLNKDLEKPLPPTNTVFPKSNISGCYGIDSGIPGENWRNEGRDAKAIYEAQKKISPQPQVDETVIVAKTKPPIDLDDDKFQGVY